MHLLNTIWLDHFPKFTKNYPYRYWKYSRCGTTIHNTKRMQTEKEKKRGGSGIIQRGECKKGKENKKENVNKQFQ
jgi:hypothetical protein